MRRRVLSAAVIALMITVLAALDPGGLLYRADNAVSDLFYQETDLPNPDIVIFGIDEDTIDQLGPVTGLRGAMAQVIERLNADPDQRPAVIGIDVMYTGENRENPDADRLLAEAAAKYGNVVVAADAAFGPEVKILESGAYYIRQRSVLKWYPPYEELQKAAKYGSVNQSYDGDGIFRHALLYVETPEEGRVLSFARVIYEQWCEVKGITPNPEPETSGNGYFYLPFSSEEQDYYDGLDFLNLYTGLNRQGQELQYGFKDRIVLIGSTGSGMQDDYPTSLNHADRMPGIAINANMIEAFQNGFYPREAGRNLQLAVLFGISFAAVCFFWNRRIPGSVLGWAAVCGLWIGLCHISYHRGGVILHLLWIPAAVSLLLAGSVAANYVRSQKEKRRVTDTFGYYIDPVIRDQLLEQGSEALELGGVTRDIAVLFVDVRGFTSMSEALDAQTVVEIVNRYLTLTTECIMRHHGTLDKFVGDCTMAIWNAPLEQEDPVMLACRAAMDMVAGSEALGEELLQRYGRKVSFGIGINWGPAVVGNIGAPKRMDYTAIGDTVNTAARLEANAPGAAILISRSVADQLGDRAVVTSLGNSIRLKGKSEEFEVLRLEKLIEAISKEPL